MKEYKYTMRGNGVEEFKYYIKDDGTIEIVDHIPIGETLVVVPSMIDDIKVTSLGNAVFIDNECITDVVISEGIKSIGSLLFNKCTDLRKIVLPNSLKEIKEDAFRGLSNQVDIVFPEYFMDKLENDRYCRYIGLGGSR